MNLSYSTGVIVLDKTDVRMLTETPNWAFLINGATPDGNFWGV
jgi:hypothetical protein